MKFLIKVLSLALMSLSVASIKVHGIIVTKNTWTASNGTESSSTRFSLYETNAAKNAELARAANSIGCVSGIVAGLLWVHYVEEEVRQNTNFGRLNSGFLKWCEAYLIYLLAGYASTFTMDALFHLGCDYPEEGMIATVQIDPATCITQCNDIINAIEQISSVKNESRRAESLMHCTTILKCVNQAITACKEAASRAEDSVILAKADELQAKIEEIMKILNDEIVKLQELQDNETASIQREATFSLRD